jgi:hypothetical protein
VFCSHTDFARGWKLLAAACHRIHFVTVAAAGVAASGHYSCGTAGEQYFVVTPCLTHRIHIGKMSWVMSYVVTYHPEQCADATVKAVLTLLIGS